MTIIQLVCPKCRHLDVYDESNIDTSNPISCALCGFSELPTSFELPKSNEPKSRQFAKIVIIIIALIVFTVVGLSVIVSAAFNVPIIIAAVVSILLYRRWNEKKTKG